MIDRRRATAWFVFLGLPLFAVFVLFIVRASEKPRVLLILDVPADVTVRIADRDLRPCKDEFQPHAGCNATPTPGFARRYQWTVARGHVARFVARRGNEEATTSMRAPLEGPTPHLRVDEEPLRLRAVGGTRIDDHGVITFVDDAGRVIGTAGPSEPD